MPKQVHKAGLPDVNALSTGLSAVFGASQCDVDILDRVPSVWASTYPSEVVTCRIGECGVLKLYCKYQAGPPFESFGHRGGVAYEIEVYRRILKGMPVGLPRFYGSYKQPATGDVALVLEYLDQSLHVTKGPQPDSVVQAARWLGRFHALNESRAASPEVRFLNSYDADYYRGWARRTLGFADSLRPALPWLEVLCARFDECFELLLPPAPTIIHGEFYPHNILLINGDEIYPIDWESAAIAVGEIDLATLTEAWKPAHLQQCEKAYRQARWNGATPPEFEPRLRAARLYACFRWMGDQAEWTLDKRNSWYFDQMRLLGRELGLI